MNELDLDKEFAPYQESLELKELGFDERCFGYHSIETKEFDTVSSDVCERLCKHGLHIKAPTFSQAFRWFREKHNLRSFVDTRVYNVDTPNQWIYDYQVKMGDGIDTQPYYSGDFDTYEEAELACLRKLIQIVKDETN